MYMDSETRLPVIIEDKCVACGACVKACPKFIIELRRRGPKGRRIFVSCVNKDKGGVAKKACGNACIGCSLCFKECKFEAITIADNLSYIDHTKCKLCRKCVVVCPTHAIHEIGFPPPKKEAPKAPFFYPRGYPYCRDDTSRTCSSCDSLYPYCSLAGWYHHLTRSYLTDICYARFASVASIPPRTSSQQDVLFSLYPCRRRSLYP